MIYPDYFDPKLSLRLIGLKDKFIFFKNLILKNELPKVTCLSGEKGSGKSTLVNHLLHFIYDEKNYNIEDNIIDKTKNFHNLFVSSTFPNIIYLKSESYKSVKIEDIRKLKQDILKTPIISNKRFVILDDVENFNLNSLTALLKIIEEPNENNYFILINNKSKLLIETIKSRSIEFKIILKRNDKDEIINSLIKVLNIKPVLNNRLVDVTPGNFIKFDYILSQNKIDPEEKLIKNLDILLKLFKKERDIFFKDLLFFLVDYNFKITNTKKTSYPNKIIEKKNSIIRNINEFFLFNLNHNTLLRLIESTISDE